MDIDYSSLLASLGAGALFAAVVGLIFWVINIVVFYLIARAAVTGGLRSHQKWIEKNRPEHAGQHAAQHAVQHAPQVVTPPQ